LRYLLDASALLPLLLDYGDRLLSVVSKVELFIIDLTMYEVGNSLWKLVVLLKTLDIRDAEDIVYVLEGFMRRGIIKIINFGELDFHRILQLAVSEKLTFYDASYIVASEVVKATLVTEDVELRRKAGKYIGTIGYEEFKRELEK
jgi:predicted nucleic acid-binding protein